VVASTFPEVGSRSISACRDYRCFDKHVRLVAGSSLSTPGEGCMHESYIALSFLVAYFGVLGGNWLLHGWFTRLRPTAARSGSSSSSVVAWLMRRMYRWCLCCRRHRDPLVSETPAIIILVTALVMQVIQKLYKSKQSDTIQVIHATQCRVSYLHDFTVPLHHRTGG
jgi:hypothetical protein